ncbi:carotenoid biosynthesis protein [Salinigranum salinum]|uniref:carotenoid biosynthesis protein n=1 Tax=Salinigranum salinum TaxID=1364937 RepID=UPI001260C495|nr:carotenoid biosynthesis protein [Salinigranum salinum]
MRLIYPAFTAAMALASLVCLLDARESRDRTILYATAVVYGLVLEKATIVFFDAYTYPAASYVFDAFGIPLAIGLGWSAVIYAGIATAERVGLTTSLPAFTALYALHVDLAMDAVAIRVPFWEWTPPGPWFGVPLGNFFGWFCVALLFPLWFRTLRRRTANPLVLGGGTLVGSLVTLQLLLEVWVRTVDSVTLGASILLVLGAGATALVVRDSPRFDVTPPRTAFVVALVYHGFFLAVLFATGIHRTTPPLVIVSGGMLLLGLAVHVRPGDLGRSVRP